jgi:hypothetical protein
MRTISDSRAPAPPWHRALLLCGLCALACSGQPAASQSQQPSPSAAPAWKFPGAARVVAIGDLHGDAGATRRALRLAGAIDAADRWIGEQLVVVQTGDQVDRGDDDLEIERLLERLEAQAQKGGGRLVVLNGNHELMNAAGDFRYVTPGALLSFAEFGGGEDRGAATQRPARGRAAAFAPGGPLARVLAQRPVIAIVGDTLFAHGGVLGAHVRYGLARINQAASAWLLGTPAELPRILFAQDAPVWTRLYSDGAPSAEACAQLADVLRRTGTRRLVVGHTVQPEINSACGGAVWRIDVGLSRHFGGPTQVLEIRGDQPRVLRANRGL